MDSEVQDRPVLNELLTGWEAIFGAGDRFLFS